MDAGSLVVAAAIVVSAVCLLALVVAFRVVRRRRARAAADAFADTITEVDLAARVGFPFVAADRPLMTAPLRRPAVEADAETEPEVESQADAEPPSGDAGAVARPGDDSALSAGPTDPTRGSIPSIPSTDGSAPSARPIDPTGSAASPAVPDGAADRRPEPLASDRLLTRAAWADAFAIEERRVARYGRPATVVLAELDGFEALSIRLGEAAAERLVGPMSVVLAEQARASDLVARVDRARFIVLMPETDEVAATNYVERVRDVSGPWLAAAAVTVRLAVGWASPATGGTLTAAMMAAEGRMNADRRIGRGR